MEDDCADVNEKPELEFDERELQREWADTVETGDNGRENNGKSPSTGVAQVGALISSAIMANS